MIGKHFLLQSQSSQILSNDEVHSEQDYICRLCKSLLYLLNQQSCFKLHSYEVCHVPRLQSFNSACVCLFLIT